MWDGHLYTMWSFSCLLCQVALYQASAYQVVLFSPASLKLNSLKGNIIKRNILSIFTELGFNRNEPIREQQPNPLPDRKELDDIIFDELGITETERNEVYWSVAELVKQRLDKAASR